MTRAERGQLQTRKINAENTQTIRGLTRIDGGWYMSSTPKFYTISVAYFWQLMKHEVYIYHKSCCTTILYRHYALENTNLNHVRKLTVSRNFGCHHMYFSCIAKYASDE
jgi:hypothetical protein